MLDDTPNADPQGQSATNDPQKGGQSEGNGATPTSNDAPLNTPDNIKGKSYEDLVKMYGEAQSQLGKMSGEVGQLRQFRDQMNPVLEVITEDREVYDKIDTNLKKKAGVVVPETSTPKTEEVDDTRSTLENRIIREFFDKHGITTLEPEKRDKLGQAISKQLLNMYDPSGKLSANEIVSKIKLNDLSNSLEDAFILAKAKTGIEIDLAAEIGSMPSGSVNTKVDKLSPEEEKVAKKQGLTPEQYLESKKLQMQAEE